MTVTYWTMTLSKLVFSTVAGIGAALAQHNAALSVSVLTGDDVIVSTQGGRGADIKVRVAGADNQPVEAAIVTAILPAIGAGGSFAGGETVKSKTTGSDGIADFKGIRIRNTPGDIPIRIVARHRGQVGSAMAYQKAANIDPGSETMLSRRRLAMIGVAVAGVTAAILATTMNGDEPARPAFSVTPGAPVTTGPR